MRVFVLLRGMIGIGTTKQKKPNRLPSYLILSDATCLPNPRYGFVLFCIAAMHCGSGVGEKHPT